MEWLKKFVQAWTDPCKEIREQYEAQCKRKQEESFLRERLLRRAEYRTEKQRV